ncbi:hypothetical protein RUM44_013443 [Polyplax serrata]|uniref:Uncharacterized protein n=1 Tax=Polyplax serrata TaxID=468196 RepID=A0ABR1BE65_POLSC
MSETNPFKSQNHMSGDETSTRNTERTKEELNELQSELKKLEFLLQKVLDERDTLKSLQKFVNSLSENVA